MGRKRDEPARFGSIGVYYAGHHPQLRMVPRRWYTMLQFGERGMSVVHVDGRARLPPDFVYVFEWTAIRPILVLEPETKVRNPGSMVGSGLSRLAGLPTRQGAFIMTVEDDIGTATFINDQIGPSALAGMLADLWRAAPDTRSRFCFPHLGDDPSTRTAGQTPTPDGGGETLADRLEAVEKALSLLADDDERRAALLAKRDQLIQRVLDEV